MNERERRHRKRVLRVYTLRFLTAAAILFILALAVLACIGVRRLMKGNRQETMAVTNQDMELLDGLKEQLEGKEFVLMLDAGHGGNDVGTGSEEYYEKDINLDIVKQMKALLEYCGVTVILTRAGDETESLDERCTMANESGADWFVSIHCNYCEEDASVAGLECYYWADSAPGLSFAERLVGAVQESGAIKIRGTKTEDFHVLRETKIPAVLVETGYISNEEEREKLMDSAYQNDLSVYLTKGIIEGYLDFCGGTK